MTTTDTPRPDTPASGAEGGTLTAEQIAAYIDAAMRHEHMERIGDGTYFATIPGMDGLWANEASIEETRRDLRGSLESWILLGLRLGHRLPIVEDIDLNTEGETT